MTDTVNACPECDTPSGIYKRHGRGTWACRECGHEFDAPVTRRADGTTNTQNGLARRLSDASPDEVGP